MERAWGLPGLWRGCSFKPTYKWGRLCVELLYGYIITLFTEQVVAEKSAFQFMRYLSFIRITRGVGIAVPIL